MELMKLALHHSNTSACDLSMFSQTEADTILHFHQSFPMYHATPLISLADTAAILGLNALWVKDESYRFGLHAFKALGGSYAIAKYLSNYLNIPMSELTYEVLTSPSVHERIQNLTFITATDGNHGRGIAWTAKQLGVHAVVYMPYGSSPERLENIRKEGADAEITDMNYDDTVRYASREADKNGWILMQDTSWTGYEELPGFIIQGYMTMSHETHRQLSTKPTHIFIQAGVGSLASSVCGYFKALYGKDCPKLIVVEAQKADCLYQSFLHNSPQPTCVTGDLNTIMAGLACGEPCSIGLSVLDACADAFISAPDYISANGMRLLGNPAGNDSRIISGESGAVCAGVVYELYRNPSYQSFLTQLELDAHSSVLCFSTEGATDLANYRKITWEGAYHA